MALLGFWGYEDTYPEPGSLFGGTATGRGGVGRSYATTGTTYTMAGSFDPISEGIVACALTWSSLSTGGAQVGIGFMEGASPIHLNLHYSTGTYAIARGGSTILDSGVSGVSNQWYYHEWKFKIHDSEGYLQWWIDGQFVGEYEGDTRNGGTGVVNRIGFGRIGGAGATGSIDDLYVMDLTDGTATQGAPFNDLLGVDTRVLSLLPTGNGDSSQWTGSDADSTDNYAHLDEQSTSTADYVQGGAGEKDLYVVGDLIAGYEPHAMRTVAVAGKSDLGPVPDVDLITKGDGSTERVETTIVGAPFDYTTYAGPIRFTDPDGDPLTETNVNAHQIGVEVAP